MGVYGMPQRILERDAQLVRRRKRRAKAAGSVDKQRRPPTYVDPWSVAYGVHMDEGQPREDWASYLRRIAGRKGWSVARLARESGIHRGTIFKWMSGKGGVNVASVRAIGTAAEGDPANAIRAAGQLELEEAIDEEIELVRTDDRLDPETKVKIANIIYDRRTREREASLAETRRLIDLMRQRHEAS